MGRARAIELDTIRFEKSGDATKFFQEMLARYSNGERVNHDDSVHLRALLQRHDDEDEKIGSGISYFFVDKSPDYNTSCFWIMQEDGTCVDFSFKHCLEAKPYD